MCIDGRDGYCSELAVENNDEYFGRHNFTFQQALAFLIGFRGQGERTINHLKEPSDHHKCKSTMHVMSEQQVARDVACSVI